MNARRILVTGASGFIGSHTLAPLAHRGFEVHALRRGTAAATDIPDIRWHAADLNDPVDVAALMDVIQPTHVLHLAWYAEHGKFWNSPLNLESLRATLGLLENFARVGGSRFVGAGTCAEYDWTGSNETCDEAETPLRPATLYGAAKASAYLTGSAFAATSKFSFAWGRVFNLFGPGEAPGRIVPALMRAHLSGTPLDCSQGTQLRDFLPVSSIAEAFADLCAGEIEGAVNIGSGKGLTLRELSESISRLAGRRGEVRFGAFPDTGPDRLVAKVDRLLQATPWRPPASLDAALAESIARSL